jgi:[protein-PII] uridylyltransferase
LFPSSDIDVLVLLPSPTPPELPERVAALIGRMWDIGLEVGHSVRTIEECLQEAAGDITIETNLLENRLIAGAATPYQQLIQPGLPARSARLLRRQDAGTAAAPQSALWRHQQSGTQYQGKPRRPARSAHHSVDQQGHRPGENWSDLAQRGILTQAEARLIHHSDRQLQRLRIDLHILARRREDRLIFDLQQSMGLAFGLQDTRPSAPASK